MITTQDALNKITRIATFQEASGLGVLHDIASWARYADEAIGRGDTATAVACIGVIKALVA